MMFPTVFGNKQLRLAVLFSACCSVVYSMKYTYTGIKVASDRKVRKTKPFNFHFRKDKHSDTKYLEQGTCEFLDEPCTQTLHRYFVTSETALDTSVDSVNTIRHLGVEVIKNSRKRFIETHL